MARKGTLMRSPRQRARQLAAWAIAALFAFIAAMWVSGIKPPPRMHLFRLLWALAHKPQFYLLTLLAVAAIVLSVLAVKIKGDHRAVLAVSWTIGITVICIAFSEVVTGMWQVIWWRLNQ